MRTKITALLGLAAVAVGLSTAQAQNVYSLNVVGYVNVTLTDGQFSFLSYPFQDVNGNFDITNTLPVGDVQTGAVLYQWLGTQWNPNNPTWYAGYGWYPDVIISNGVGFFILPAATSTLTMVGQVQQGAISYTIPTGLSTLANMVPVSTNFPTAAVGNNADNMLTWGPGQEWNPNAWTYYAGYGWDNGGNPGDSADGPLLNPGDAVFYENTAGAIPFTQNFTVQ